MKKETIKSIVPGGVDEYIANCPDEVQGNLKAIRKDIQEVAPSAKETVSYFQIPGYFYEGYDYNGMFVWFSYQKPYIRLHLRPPVIQDHKNELKGLRITKGIVSFPANNAISSELTKKLVKASLVVMKASAKS